MTNWLQGAADIATIATSLVSWCGLVGLALAITAWAVVDWRKVYYTVHLGTQMSRLQNDQFILNNVIFPDNYLRMSPAIRDRATSAINRHVLFFP